MADLTFKEKFPELNPNQRRQMEREILDLVMSVELKRTDPSKEIIILEVVTKLKGYFGTGENL